MHKGLLVKRINDKISHISESDYFMPKTSVIAVKNALIELRSEIEEGNFDILKGK